MTKKSKPKKKYKPNPKLTAPDLTLEQFRKNVRALKKQLSDLITGPGPTYRIDPAKGNACTWWIRNLFAGGGLMTRKTAIAQKDAFQARFTAIIRANGGIQNDAVTGGAEMKCDRCPKEATRFPYVYVPDMPADLDPNLCDDCYKTAGFKDEDESDE
jgi:hypothetical protein